MKWRSLIFLFTCLMMQKLVSGEDDPITMKKDKDTFIFICSESTWKIRYNGTIDGSKLTLYYRDEDSGHYDCPTKDSVEVVHSSLTVKFRTCENCIELDAPALSAIIVGNLLATFLIACAIYSITGQPKGKNFSGNKASDKVNLITNGDGDTYQPLTGHSSEYSRLERKK